MTHKPLPIRKLTMQEHQKIWWARNGHIVCAMRKEQRAEARAAREAAKDERFQVRKPLPKEKKE